jgi:hypothetical protein
MSKLTVAKINEMAREVAMKEIAEKGLTEFLQVEGTKFAKDFEFQTPEGLMVKTVRVDIVVPKLEAEENAQTLAEDYEFKLQEKAEKDKEKAEAKAKKIARDEKRRAEAKAQKEAQVVKTTIVHK